MAEKTSDSLPIKADDPRVSSLTRAAGDRNRRVGPALDAARGAGPGFVFDLDTETVTSPSRMRPQGNRCSLRRFARRRTFRRGRAKPGIDARRFPRDCYRPVES